MATLTKNFSFKKPEYNESADIGVINEDMDLIDAELQKQKTDQQTLKNNQTSMEATLAKKLDKEDTAHLLADTDKALYDAHLKDTDNPHKVTKAQVGLGAADNTADADKPVSGPQQAALDLKVDKVAGGGLLADTDKALYDAHLKDTDNPHKVTKASVGLGAADNTADAQKPVSAPQQEALDDLEARCMAAINAAALTSLGLVVVDGLLCAEYEN